MADDDAPLPDTIRAPEPGEGTPQAEARGARDTVAAAVEQRAARKRPGPMGPPAPPAADVREAPFQGENPLDRDRQGPQDDGPADLERAKLNMVNSYYRGTAAGALALKLWSTIYQQEDGPDMDQGMKEARQRIRDQYEETVMDLMRYDMMPSWSGLPQLSAAVGGTLAGALPSPESFLGWAAQGATWTARTMKAAIQQGLISAATDPIVQHLNMDAGVQKDFSYAQTGGAALLGAGIGGGAHAIGEGAPAAWRGLKKGVQSSSEVARDAMGDLGATFIGQRELRRHVIDLANVDPGMDAPHIALWRLDPRNGTPMATPAREQTFELQPVAPAERPQYEPGPPQSFAETVAMEKERLAASAAAADEAAATRPGRTTGDEAKFNAFHEEAGDILDQAIATHQLDPEHVRYGDIWKFYDRQPGQAPEEALESAIGRWVSEEERRASVDPNLDGEFSREMAEWTAAYDAERERMQTLGQDVSPEERSAMLVFGQGATASHIPGVSPILRDYRPAHLPEEIPFEHPRPDAAEGSDLPASRAAPSREGEGVAGGGQEPAVRSERGGAGPTAEASATRQAAVTDRGERLGGPAETTGGKPKETFAEQIARMKAERKPAEDLVKGALTESNPRLVLRKGDQAIMLSKGTMFDAPYRITSFDKDGPVGHRDYDTGEGIGGLDGMVQEVHSALRNGYAIEQKAASAALPAEPRNVSSDTVAAAAAKMPAEVRSEFEFLYAMGASKGQAASRDTARFNQLLDQYGGETKAPLATERTEQGEQTLVPGVAPVTDRQRVEAEMAKPMAGGSKAPPAGGLFDEDARAQGDIFALRANRANNVMPGEERLPDSGIGTGLLSPDEEVRLRSLHQLSVELANKLGIPLRQGRMTRPGVGRQTLGIYLTRQGNIRVREIADFEVVKHEVGHAIEARVGQDLTDLTLTHRYEMAPLDYDQGPTGQRPNEGFAEWMRIRMTNPPSAQRLAPNFSNDFEALMARDAPDILRAIDQTAQAHRAFLQAAPLDTVATMVRNTVPLEDRMFGRSRRIAQEIEDEGLPPVVNTYMTKAWQWMQRRYDNFFDHMQDMERATRDLLAMRQEQQGGGLVNLPDAFNPYTLLRSARRSGQFAFTEIMGNIKDFRSNTGEGPGLRDVFNHALGQPQWRDHYGKAFGLGRWNNQRLEHFDQYVAARMSLYLWERYDQGLIPNEPSPIKPGRAAAVVDELQAMYPTFQRAGDMLNEMYARVRKKKFDAGLWSKEMYDLTSEYEFYVPMKRVMEEGGGTGGMRSGSTIASSVRRRVGSERDIDSPLRNVMRDIFFMEHDIRQNEIKGALITLAESVPTYGGAFIERLPAHEARVVQARLGDMIKERANEIGMTPAEAQTMIDTLLNGEDGPLVGRMFEMQRAAANGEPIVFHWQNGEPIPYRVMSRPDRGPPQGAQPGLHPDPGSRYKLFELLTESPQPVLDLYSNLVSLGAGVLRGGVTTNPMFIISNFLRDQFQAALSQPGYIPFYHGARGIIAEVRQSEMAAMRAETGVMGGSLVGEVEHKFNAGLDDMRKQGYLVKRLTSWKGLLELMTLTESGTRNSIFEIVYNQKLRQGLSEYEAAFEARHRSDDIMDFSRHGDRMAWVRQNIPFLNATLQGSERYLFRGMIEPFTRRVLTVQDQEARNRAYYTWLMSAAGGIAGGMAYAAMMWEKDAYRDAIPEIKGKNVVIPLPDGLVALMPKPFELSLGFTVGEHAYAHLFKHDQRAAHQLRDALWEAVRPPDPVRNMPVVTPAVELATNYSFFREGPIVPDRLRNQAMPEMEYDDKTSSLAKYIGKTMGWSPMKVDYATGSLFGTNGRDVLSATSMLDRDTPAAALDDTVLIRRFIKNEERISGRAKQFWQLMAAKNGRYADVAQAYRQVVTEAVNRGLDPNAPSELMKTLNDSEKVYVTLKEGATARGAQAFTADDRRMHPLARAHEAVLTLYGIARDIQSNTLVPYREKEKIPLSPEQRRELIDDVRTLAGQEMRNAFVVVGQKGYEGRPILDVNDQMDLIRKVSPSVAKEIETRYATAKIYNFEAVRDAWPELQQEVIRNGSEARIGRLTSRARAQGYEFRGQRAKRPGPVRAPIPGQP